MSFSKEQFIEWTTKGYPLKFNENITKDKFFQSLSDFINFNDNEYFSEELDEVINIYKGSETIASIKYNYQDERLVILTLINSGETTSESEEFLMRQKDLGEVCFGVITFCQCMDQYVFENIPQHQSSFEPWPLSS